MNRAAHLRAVTDAQPRAIIYLRQSVHRDDSISLELQELACRDYCTRAGYQVTAVESDPGISGRTWNRPAVQRVMAAIEEHQADVIVLWRWSRLSRSRKDWALAIDRTDIAGGKIESATEPIDTATASGRFARGVMTEYAAFQSEQIGEQWEEVRQRRLGLGLPASGRLPFGWTRQDSGIAPNPVLSPVVVEMYRRYLSGEGAASIARWLNGEGIAAPNGGLWSRNRPLTVMNSPIHAGMIPYRGNIYPGTHEGIIDKHTWDAYQAEHRRRTEGREKPREHAHLLSQLVICECGARMHGKGSVTGGKHYSGYLCGAMLNGHSQRAYISAKRLDPAITQWLMTLDPNVHLHLPTAPSQIERDRLNREINALHTELTNLTRQLGRDLIPETAYRAARDEIETAVAAHQRDLDAIDAPAKGMTAEDLGQLRDAWPEMTTAAKNRGLRKAISWIRIQENGRKAQIKPTWGDSSELIL